jgi:EAL domain-containing protein (putative c-di-GMP-specific phosphodiesterase class I)
VYQPKVDPRSGVVLGAEALCRWRYDGAPVSPDEFIPLAERSGIIHRLTLQVLETALHDCAAWRRAGHHLSVAVNLSPRILTDETLVDAVRHALKLTGMPGTALTLEITENAVMNDPANSIRTLHALRSLGVALSIDDFGTGHSSLGRLAALPISEVKIDKSFVRHLTTDRNRRAVTDASLQLGHALELVVVAEGVEDAAEYEYLRQNGCDAIQGYYVSRPLRSRDFAAWLDERHMHLSRGVRQGR